MTALNPNLLDAARAARRLRNRHTRRASQALASGWRWITKYHLEEAAAADLESAQLLREAVA